MIVLLLLGLAGLALMQIPGLVQNKWWRELMVFIILWLSGLVLSLLLVIGIKIPPVTTMIGNLISRSLGM